MPFLTKIPVAIAMHKHNGYNNQAPRSQQAALKGFGARAVAGHQNAFEAVIIFAPAILLAIATGNTSTLIQQLAIAHIAARIVYQLLYLANLSTLRSIVWGIGLITSLTIVWQCLP